MLADVPTAPPVPDLVLEAGARIQVAARLVERKRQHARILVIDPLHAVAVVNVNIDVHDAPIGMLVQHLAIATAGSL